MANPSGVTKRLQARINWGRVSTGKKIEVAHSLVSPKQWQNSGVNIMSWDAGQRISLQDYVAENAIDYINSYILSNEGSTASLINISDELEGLYTLNINISGEEHTSYLTKDGALLLPSAISVEGAEELTTYTPESVAELAVNFITNNLLDEGTPIELVNIIGEYDFRLVEGASERIQLEALLAQFMKYKK